MSDIKTALTNSFQDHYATLDNDRITDAWDRIFQSVKILNGNKNGKILFAFSSMRVVDG